VRRAPRLASTLLAVHPLTVPYVCAGIKAKRLSALTGADAPDAVVSRTWDTTVNAKYDPTTIKTGRVSLTPGERGCSMSHAVLWARCAAQGDCGPPLLVVEDDLILKDGAGEMVQKLVTHFEKTNPIPAQRLCLLYLTGDVAEWRHPRSQSIDSCPQVKLREAEYIWQTACYVIWPAAARRLLASLPVDGPVDNFISRHTLSSQVCALVTQPKLAWQNAPYEEGDIAHSGHVSNKRVRASKDSMSSPTKTKKVLDEAASPGTHLMHHLGELPGIGPKLAQTLRKHARTLPGGLVEANQLEGIPGLGAKRQADIVRYLQLKTSNSP
jgi:GR25 family glycosyltransferase involved in LPS biosynthesis